MPLRYLNVIPEPDPNPPEKEEIRCEHCGYVMDECECYFCHRCGELEDYSNCERCQNCYQLMEDCDCDRCPHCHELQDECECVLTVVDAEEDPAQIAGGWLEYQIPTIDADALRAAIDAQIRQRRDILNVAPAPVAWTMDATNPGTVRFTAVDTNTRDSRTKRVEEPKHWHPNILDTLEPYVKYELRTAPHSMLTPTGVEEVRAFLYQTYHLRWTYTDVADVLGLEETIQNFTWSFNGEEHKVGGKFINRLAKALHIRYNIEVNPKDKNSINNRIQDHWVGGDKFWIDRATRIDWEAGQFGEKKNEEGSCWWYGGGIHEPTSRVSRFSAAMPDLTGAVRLWLKNGETYYGVGRVWSVRTRAGFPILFNGYGFNTMQWAAKLSRHFGADSKYKSVELGIDPDIVVNNHSGVAFDYLEPDLKGSYRFHLTRGTE